MKRLALALILTLTLTAVGWFAFTALSPAAQELPAAVVLRAEQGDGDAQAELGVRYYAGEGVPQGYVEAEKWCLRAVEDEQVSERARECAEQAAQAMTDPD